MSLSAGQPWRRQQDPEPVPVELDVRSLLELDDDMFLRVIRDNLLPRHDRDAWQRLWSRLAGSDELADRAFDALEVLIGDCEHDLASGLLDEKGTSRATKYLEQCTIAWRRLEDDTGGKRLQWAGRAGSGFPPGAQKVIGALVQAIDDHRSQRQAEPGGGDSVDHELWAVLRRVDLDPQIWTTKSR